MDADKRKNYKSMFISSALAVFLTGVTEPLEFMFMFCAMPLYIVYAILQGCAFAMAGIIHLRLHSFGNLEFITRIPMSLQEVNQTAAAVARMLEEAGCAYHWSWLPAKIGYDRYDEGMAVFSRAPITAAENLLLSQINDYNNWKTRRALGICAGDVWYYAVHLGWWKDEEEPFADQWNILAAAAGAKPLAFLLGDFNSEADVRGEGYDLILRSGWQDTYRLARQRDDGYTVVQAIDGWRDAPDAAAKKRIDQIWCSQAVPVHSSRVVFGGKQEPRVSDHAGVLIEVER